MRRIRDHASVFMANSYIICRPVARWR